MATITIGKPEDGDRLPHTLVLGFAADPVAPPLAADPTHRGRDTATSPVLSPMRRPGRGGSA